MDNRTVDLPQQKLIQLFFIDHLLKRPTFTTTVGMHTQTDHRLINLCLNGSKKPNKIHTYNNV